MIRAYGPVGLVVTGLVSIGCGNDTTTPVELEPPVACGTQLPGPALPNVVENEPSFVTMLDSLDLSTVPDPYDYSGEIALTRGLINYMLGRAEGTSFTHAEAQAAGALGRAVLGAVAVTGDNTLDIFFLRQGLYWAYPCSTTLPATLDELVGRYGEYNEWDTVIDDCAPPKNMPRRVLMNHNDGVYVAETLMPDGAIRETEVLFTKMRGDGSLDFAVYTPEGLLSDRSSFATTAGETIVGASPFTCMTCHADKMTWTFSIQQPFGTGAGCR
ncbi:MAG: hypothetical protein AB7O24_12305 [Kofleriaceae bacterium]